jgi:hypothetical protein
MHQVHQVKLETLYIFGNILNIYYYTFIFKIISQICWCKWCKSSYSLSHRPKPMYHFRKYGVVHAWCMLVHLVQIYHFLSYRPKPMYHYSYNMPLFAGLRPHLFVNPVAFLCQRVIETRRPHRFRLFIVILEGTKPHCL